MKVTDTSLLLDLSQWLDVETTLLSAASNGLVSGKALKGNVQISLLSVHMHTFHQRMYKRINIKNAAVVLGNIYNVL